MGSKVSVLWSHRNGGRERRKGKRKEEKEGEKKKGKEEEKEEKREPTGPAAVLRVRQQVSARRRQQFEEVSDED